MCYGLDGDVTRFAKHLSSANGSQEPLTAAMGPGGEKRIRKLCGRTFKSTTSLTDDPKGGNSIEQVACLFLVGKQSERAIQRKAIFCCGVLYVDDGSRFVVATWVKKKLPTFHWPMLGLAYAVPARDKIVP